MKKRNWLYIVVSGILSIIFIVLLIITLMVAIEDKMYIDFLPVLIASTIFAVLFAYIFVIEAFIGYKEYYFFDGFLIIKRKNKEIIRINKNDVNMIKIVKDVCTNKLHIISFKYMNKNYYITINENNEKDIILFMEKINSTIKKNYWYYILSFLSH